MNYYRACHYNKLLKVHTQRGQVYYFSLPSLGSDDLNGSLKLGEFHTSSQYVLDFGPFCTIRPFFTLCSLFFLFSRWRENGLERTERQGEKCQQEYQRASFPHSSNSSLPLARLYTFRFSFFFFFWCCCTGVSLLILRVVSCFFKNAKVTPHHTPPKQQQQNTN